MFGVICAGRRVQPPQQIEPTKFMLSVANASNIHHIVVFLLPDANLDPNVAASVYFQLPGKEFRLLGAISNDKPSAIFKINNNAMKQHTGVYDLDAMVDVDDNTVDPEYVINIGISLEPMRAVEEAMAAQKQAATPTPTRNDNPPPVNTQAIAQVATKIYQHAYNYMSGFTSADGKIPLKAFDDWWNKFKSRLQNNPKFLDDL